MDHPMARTLFLSLAAAACCLVAAARSTHADEFKLEDGFTRLDNGKDLEGWAGNTTGWSVEEGAIHLNSKLAKGNLNSKTTHTGNCIIRLEFRAAKRADSGVFIHGKQLQVRDYPTAGPKEYAGPAKPAGEWNALEFDITDGVAVVKLNGQVIEKAWKLGGNAKQGVGLQKESGDFDFRYLRLMEKK
jgi:hypothetical protein